MARFWSIACVAAVVTVVGWTYARIPASPFTPNAARGAKPAPGFHRWRTGYRPQDRALEACDRCSQAAAFSGWKLEPYGAVEWTSNAGVMTLASVANPGGLFFRRALDPDKTYRLQLAGRAVSGGPTVRLTIGQSEPKWFPAPNGAKHLTVSGRESIEVVVYGDTAYSYLLDGLAIDECAACLTDRQLAALILGQVPTLKTALERDRRAAARSLLNWTANIVDLGLGEGVDAATSLEYEMGAAEAYQELWFGRSSGTACGGFADFFAKVLTLFGFDAFTVNVGYAGTPITHVTTVAVIDGQFYLLDPTFNGEYVDVKSGDLLPLGELLGKSQAGERDYAFRTDPIARDLVFSIDSGEAASRVLSNVGVKASECEPEWDEAGEARYVCRHVPYDGRVLRAEWKNELSRLHLEWNDDIILNLMRHRVSSLSTTSAETKQHFLQVLSSYGIPH